MKSIAKMKNKRKSGPKKNKAEKKTDELENRANAASANFAVSMMERQIEANRTGKSLNERSIEDTEEFTEYSPSYEERIDNRIPKRIAELSNDFGKLSIGMDRKKNMTILASRKAYEDTHTPYEDSTRLKGERSSKISGLSGRFLVNNIRPEASAAAYKESSDKSSLFMLERMKELVEKEDLEIMETSASFLSTAEEVQELEELRCLHRYLLEEGNYREAGELGRRIEFLNRTLSNKEVQKRQLSVKLTTAIEEIRSGRRGKGFSEGMDILRRLMPVSNDGQSNNDEEDSGEQSSGDDWSQE